MKLGKKITTGLLALTLATGIAGTGLAAETADGDVDVEIVKIPDGGDVLSVSITDLDFGSFEYQLAQRTPTGTITISASDMRGTAGGWQVTLAGEDFSTQDTVPITFAIGNLSLPAGTVNHVGAGNGHPTNALPSPAPAAPVTVLPQVVLAAPAGEGAGVYENPRPGTQLTIPGGTLVGDYQSTLTVTIGSIAP